MNSTQIRIDTETKQELERLMKLKLQQDNLLRITHSEFISEMVQSYKEHQRCKH